MPETRVPSPKKGTELLVLLAVVWMLVMGGLGVFFPYYSLFLRENAGLSGVEVGAVMAIPPLVGLVMQPVWGQLGDRGGSRIRVLRILLLWAACGYLGLLAARGVVGFALATFVFAMASVAMIPTLVSVTLAFTRESSGHALGRVRVWGTIGFAITVLSFPHLLDAFQDWQGLVAQPGGAEPGLGLMFVMAASLVLLGGVLSFALRGGGAEALRAERGDWRQLLRHPPFVRLLIYSFLGYLFIQGPMALFPILVRSQGGGVDAISHMWLLMLALEVPLIAWLGASVARLGLRGVIGLGMLAGGLRWIVSGYVEDLFWVTAVQLLHGVVVWGVIMGTPMYIDAVVPERLRSTGQAFLAMMGVSLGGFLSNLIAGYLIDHVSPAAPAQVGGVAALVLALLTPWILPPAERRELEIRSGEGAPIPGSGSSG